MAARINYEDNIFYLSSIIKSLSTGVALEIDRDFFRDKIIEDIAFVHSTLTRLHKSLKDNVYLIRRADYMRELTRAIRSFCEFLDTLIENGTSFTEELSDALETFQRYRREQAAMLVEFNRALSAEPPASSEQEDIVGRDEYRFLFEEAGDE